MDKKKIYRLISLGFAVLSTGMLIASFTIYAVSDLPFEIRLLIIQNDILAAIGCALISIAFAQHKR